MKILITGDFAITDEYKSKDLLDLEIQNYFNNSDYNIVNLEAPICNDNEYQKLLKTGPNLRVHENSVIPQLKLLNADMVTLASNHILDYGESALINTLRVLNKHSIEYAGAGKNNEHANIIKTISKEDISIAVINFCENEWSTTFNDFPGANPLDIVDNTKIITHAKKTHDKVICIFHGGHQLNKYPSPNMQKTLRFYADQGADAIICHHTHIISGYEEYKNVPIAYGLGNFLFTLPYKYEGFHNGVIAELTVTKNDPIQFKPQFVKQDSNSHYLSFCKEDTLLTIKQEFLDISNQIKNRIFLEEKWNEFINSKSNTYLQALSGYSLFPNKYLRFVLKRLGFSLINKNKAKILLNHIRCESHRELSIEVLKRYLYEKNK